MIAAGIEWGSDSRFDLPRIVQSLGLLSSHPADSETLDDGVVARLRPAQRNRRKIGGFWRASRTPSGAPVLLHGWIDNAVQIASELGLAPDIDDAALYGAAVESWGISAERRIVGDYAAIMLPAAGVMRLSRAPWSVNTLFYASDGPVTLAASIPRPIFAAGFPKTFAPDRYAEALYALASEQGDQHFFEGLRFVPQGSVVTIDHGRAETTQWYDPHAIAPIRLKNDDDYVVEANRLLGEAVGSALALSERPGLLLSGGLDSPLIAAEMLAQLPDGRRLASFTFEPLAGEHEPVLGGQFHSDRPFVEAFAAMHPAIDPHYIDNRGIGFGHRMEDIFLASDTANPIMSATEFHGPYQAAAQVGCDWLFTGDWGNQTFSNDGRWGFVEFFRTGQWAELWRMLRDAPGDDRSMLRKLAARSILPNLPATVRSAMRTLLHGEANTPLVRKEIAEQLDLPNRYRQRYGDREWIRSRSEFIEETWQSSASGGEMTYGLEQLYGLRLRAVPQYRPLFEFCLAIPTGQYVRKGQMRWLARRMAKGRMPEAQRLNQRYGRHGVDWHQRNTPRVADMRGELERIADDPVMSRIVDVDRAIDLLDRWPDRPTFKAKLEIYMPVAAAIIAGRFARYVDGRN